MNGVALELEHEDVVRALASVQPEPVRQYAIRIGAEVYPVKQAFELATGISRREFQSGTARRHLARLGFEIVVGTAAATPPVSSLPESVPGRAERADRGWPWEGEVQSLFAAYLVGHGWRLVSMADTATREHGVDVVAHKAGRYLGAEVKGWPSTGYADVRRAAETKKTRPATQAGHWYAQALMKAIMLLDSQPGHESLMVLPDMPRYRDLAERTRTGRTAARVHVLFVSGTGSVDAEGWTP